MWAEVLSICLLAVGVGVVMNQNLGGVGRVFGAMMGKLGIPIATQVGGLRRRRRPTRASKQAGRGRRERAHGVGCVCQIGPTTLVTAKEICAAGLSPSAATVPQLLMGQTVHGKTDRQEGCFFVLTYVRTQPPQGSQQAAAAVLSAAAISSCCCC